MLYYRRLAEYVFCCATLHIESEQAVETGHPRPSPLFARWRYSTFLVSVTWILAHFCKKMSWQDPSAMSELHSKCFMTTVVTLERNRRLEATWDGITPAAKSQVCSALTAPSTHWVLEPCQSSYSTCILVPTRHLPSFMSAFPMVATLSCY